VKTGSIDPIVRLSDDELRATIAALRAEYRDADKKLAQAWAKLRAAESESGLRFRRWAFNQ
jgi:hypothetical protein